MQIVFHRIIESDESDVRWNDHIMSLEMNFEKTGEIIPTVASDKYLNSWCHSQIQLAKVGALSVDKLYVLAGVGFPLGFQVAKTNFTDKNIKECCVM